MDNRSLTVEQAAVILAKNWEDGQADFYSVVRRLPQPTIESLMELVVVDAQAAAGAGFTVDLSDYIQYFPQLEPHRKSIEARLTSMYSQLSMNSHKPAPAAPDMYSSDSILETQDFKSGSKSESDAPHKSLLRAIANREVPFELGNFVVEKFIGAGSFGTVWAGRDKRLNRKVAIKVQHDASGGLLDGFLHEAKSIARLEHPNIVRLLQADETEEGIGYLVYEYVEGETLDERIKHGNHTLSEYVHWIASIADALDYAHRCAIIHRDISPRNIMITNNGVARLLDFGLSSVDGDFFVEDKDRILGTPAFMSPEQASGNPHWATSYSDQFSLGSVLYYALTKKFAFGGKSTFDILERIQKAAPASLRSIRADVPVKLEEVCLRALAKEPQQRYSTAADMAAALINSLATPIASPTSRPATVALANYPLLALGALLAVVGVVVSVVGFKQLFVPSASSVVANEPTIDKLDVQVSLPGATQVSLFENQPDGGLAFTKSASFTFKANMINRKQSRIYLFNYQETSGEPIGQWSSIEVEGDTTTIKPRVLRPGPNLIAIVSSDKPLPESPANAAFLPTQPFDRQSVTDTSLKAHRLNRSVYMFYNRASFEHKDYDQHVVLRSPSNEMHSPGTSEFLRQLKENWDDNTVQFNKGNLGDYAYCAIALWINQEPIAGTP